MTECLLCNKKLREQLNFSQLFSFKKIQQECLCLECRSQFSSLKDQRVCLGCGRLWKKATSYCLDCQKWQQLEAEELQECLNHKALYEYNQWMKAWIEQFKFKGDYRLGQVFAQELRAELLPLLDAKTIIVPIPLSEESYHKRGFNQVEALLDFARLPYKGVLINTTTEKQQSSKNRFERLEMSQPFAWKSTNNNYLVQLKGKRIILLDDVYTTGRTLLHAKKIILKADVCLLKSLSLAR